MLNTNEKQYVHNKKIFHIKSPLSSSLPTEYSKTISKNKKPKSRNSLSTSLNHFKLNTSITFKKTINNTIINNSSILSKNTLSKPKKLCLKKLTANPFPKVIPFKQNKIEIKKDNLISLIKSKANNLRQKQKSFLDSSSNEHTQTKLSTETSATSKRNKHPLPTSLKHINIYKCNKHKEDELINVITEESVISSKNNSCSKNKGNVYGNCNKKMVQQLDLDANIEISLTYSDDTVTKRRYAVDIEGNGAQTKKRGNNTRNQEWKGGNSIINIQEQNCVLDYANKGDNNDFQSFCEEMQLRLFGC